MPEVMEKTETPVATEKVCMEKIQQEIRSKRDEFAKQGYVPRAFMTELKKLGIFRAATPQCFGGSGMSPTRFLKLIEQISEADGSVGWVASFGSASVYLAALPKETQAKMYAESPDLVFAGGLFPIQPAEKVDGGWMVNGTWKFASGCKGADFLGVGVGAAIPGQVGSKPRTAVLPRDKVNIIDNWNVMGLQATGSHDLKVLNQYVEDEWTFIRGGESTIDEPLYRYPTIAYAAQVLAVVNLGLARAALDEIEHMADGRVAITGAPKLGQRAYVRIAVAQNEAKLRSVQGFFYGETEAVWQSILAGNPVTSEQVSMLRLTATEAARVGFEVVQNAFGLAGTTAIYLSHPLQRYLRDAAVVKQHAFLGEGIYDGAGAVTLGEKPIPGFL